MQHRHSSLFLLSALLLTALLLLSAAVAAHAQQIAHWRLADTAYLRYRAPDDVGNTQDLLAAADEQHIVSLTFDPIVQTKQFVRRTTDGGAQWTEVLRDTTARTWESIAHPAPGTIVIAGDTVERAVGGGTDRYHGRCWITRDGGATWASIPLDPDTRVLDLATCSADHGAMVVISTTSGTEPAYILRTNDAWNTFSKVVLPSGYRFVNQLVCPAPNVYVLRLYDPAQQKMILVRTADGGATWGTSQAIEEVRKMFFLGADTGWSATGRPNGTGDQQRDVILRTTDGGLTWHTLLDREFGPLPFGLTAVAFADAEHGIAVGAAGKILRTTDAGATWTREYPPSHLMEHALPIMSLVHPGPNSCVAAHFYGPVIRRMPGTVLAFPTFLSPPKNELQEINGVTVRWTSIEGATRYQLMMAPTNGSTWDTTIYASSTLDTTLSDTSIVLNGLAYGHQYYVRVRAFNTTQTSDWARGEALFVTRNSPSGLQPSHAGNSSRLTVHPNPATDVLRIVAGTLTATGRTVQIYDALGRRVRSVQTGEETITLDISDLPAGAYSVLVATGTAIECGRVVVQR